MLIAPSPTADATRLTLPARTSPPVVAWPVALWRRRNWSTRRVQLGLAVQRQTVLLPCCRPLPFAGSPPMGSPRAGSETVPPACTASENPPRVVPPPSVHRG